MRETVKEIKIGDSAYRLSKMSAQIASWLYSLLLSSMIKAQQGARQEVVQAENPAANLQPEEIGRGVVEALWMTSGSVLSEEQHAKVQQHALRQVSYYITPDSEPAPILMKDGRVADEKTSDPVIYNRLVLESLQFNLAPFFTGGASTEPAQTTSLSSR